MASKKTLFVIKTLQIVKRYGPTGVIENTYEIYISVSIQSF
jgi:hypothetical protein